MHIKKYDLLDSEVYAEINNLGFRDLVTEFQSATDDDLIQIAALYDGAKWEKYGVLITCNYVNED